MKLLNFLTLFFCLPFLLILSNCKTNTVENKNKNRSHSSGDPDKIQAQETSESFIKSILKSDDQRKALYKKAFEAAYLKNLKNKTITTPITGDSITNTLKLSINHGVHGCLGDFFPVNDFGGGILLAHIRPAGFNEPKPVFKNKEEMTDFFDNLIKLGVENNCFK